MNLSREHWCASKVPAVFRRLVTGLCTRFPDGCDALVVGGIAASARGMREGGGDMCGARRSDTYLRVR